ncbi:MAG: hypothetical protein WBX01_14575 [Nitrososphaeraceae archaeon]
MKPYIFDIPADFYDPFGHPAKQLFKYLCDDCYKTLSRELTPGYARLREAQYLLDGKGDEEGNDSDVDEEGNKRNSILERK